MEKFAIIRINYDITQRIVDKLIFDGIYVNIVEMED